MSLSINIRYNILAVNESALSINHILFLSIAEHIALISFPRILGYIYI